MGIDEDESAARVLGDILTSVMLDAHGHEVREPRTWLYSWERDGLQWLLRFCERNPNGSIGNDWIRSFLALNREAILQEGGRMDFNLKAALDAASIRSRTEE